MKNVIMTLSLVAAATTFAACESMNDGKTYPAPYAHERTAGAQADSASPVFEKKMRK